MLRPGKTAHHVCIHVCPCIFFRQKNKSRCLFVLFLKVFCFMGWGEVGAWQQTKSTCSKGVVTVIREHWTWLGPPLFNMLICEGWLTCLCIFIHSSNNEHLMFLLSSDWCLEKLHRIGPYTFPSPSEFLGIHLSSGFTGIQRDSGRKVGWGQKIYYLFF